MLGRTPPDQNHQGFPPCGGRLSQSAVNAHSDAWTHLSWTVVHVSDPHIEFGLKPHSQAHPTEPLKERGNA